jgi:hypothetical protein
MTPAEVYLDYLALTRHFSSTYDYFKYGGKIKNLKRETFDARADKWMFEKLSRRQNPRWMIIGSLLAGKKWIGDMYGDEAEELAAKRMKNVQSLGYVMRHDMEQLDGDDFDAHICYDGRMPAILQACLAGRIQVETLAAVVGLTGCHEYWIAQGDPALTEFARRAAKYSPFLEMDREKVRKIVVDRYRAKETT